MKYKITVILKIVGVLLVLGAVAYDLLYKNAQVSVYWIMLIAGIAAILAGRIGERITVNNHDEDE